MTRNVLALSGLCAALLLSGCGSDSTFVGDSAPPITTSPAEGAEGTWRGNINTPTANARLAEIFLLGNGDFWMAYSTANDPTQTDALINAAGVIHGTAVSNDDGTFSVGNARHISIEDGKRNNASITGTYVTGSTLGGTLTQTPVNPTAALPSPADFSSLYRTAYNNNLTLAHLAGSYTGSLTLNAGKSSATLTIGSDGAISGSNNAGCSFSGEASARERGNVFNVNLTMGAEAACAAVANLDITGVVSLETNRIGLIALDSEQKQPFILVGNK